jgi:very-short-patch-repair endonuclease
VNDRQHAFAREMRADPTDAECKLWPRLKHDIPLAGSHVRRPALIGPFIVDFASRKAKLVIELDGGQHDGLREADARRSAYIEARGYRVLRFWNHEVFENIDGVLQVVQSVVTPIPDPSPQGGRGHRARSVRLKRRSAADKQASPSPFPPCGEGPGMGVPQAMTYRVTPKPSASNPPSSRIPAVAVLELLA